MKSDLFNKYAAAISDISGIRTSDIFSKNKARAVADARNLLYYMCKKRMMTPAYIRKYMSDKGYDTGFFPIAYGIKSVEKKLDSDPDYNSIVELVDKKVHR